MRNNVILRFDEEDFRSSCIDGFKIVINKRDITLEEIKLIRDTLKENDYYVENFRLESNDILEVEGGLENMPSVESLYDLVNEVKTEENMLMKILYKLMYFNIEISLYVSGLY